MIERLRRWWAAELRRLRAPLPEPRTRALSRPLGERHALWVARMMSAEDGGARRPASLLRWCARLDLAGTAPEEWEVKLKCQN